MLGLPNLPHLPRFRSLGAFAEIAAAITAAGSVALDVETFGSRKSDALNPWRGDMRLLSLKVADREPWLIDLQATGYDLGPLSTALESVLVIAHNLKFDALWLAVKCGLRLRRSLLHAGRRAPAQRRHAPRQRPRQMPGALPRDQTRRRSQHDPTGAACS